MLCRCNASNFLIEKNLHNTTISVYWYFEHAVLEHQSDCIFPFWRKVYSLHLTKYSANCILYWVSSDSESSSLSWKWVISPGTVGKFLVLWRSPGIEGSYSDSVSDWRSSNRSCFRRSSAEGLTTPRVDKEDSSSSRIPAVPGSTKNRYKILKYESIIWLLF